MPSSSLKRKILSPPPSTSVLLSHQLMRKKREQEEKLAKEKILRQYQQEFGAGYDDEDGERDERKVGNAGVFR